MVSISACIAFAGSLNPPAAPAATMKTLGEIEPRIPLGQSDFPKTITESGSYYLTGNIEITTADTALTITADDVQIDLNNFVITGPNIAGGNGIAIDCQKNITIKNGTIRGFGGRGIYDSCTSAKSIRVINVKVLDNAGSGVYLAGSNHLVSNCKVSGNGSSTAGDFYGIYCGGSDCQIADNIITGNGSHCSGSWVYGIKAGIAGQIQDNVVGDNFVSAATTYIYCIGCGNDGIVGENTVGENMNSSSEPASASEVYCLAVGEGGNVYNNTISNNGKFMTATKFYCMLADNGSTVNDNTIGQNAGWTVISGTLYGLYLSTSVAKNNIVYNNRYSAQEGSGTRYGLYANYSNLIKDNVLVANGNNMYLGAPSGCVVVDNVAP